MHTATQAPVKDYIERQILVGKKTPWILNQVAKHFPTSKHDASHIMHFALLLKREGAISEEAYTTNYSTPPTVPAKRAAKVATETKPKKEKATPVKRSSAKEASATAKPAKKIVKAAKSKGATATDARTERKSRRKKINTGPGVKHVENA